MKCIIVGDGPSARGFVPPEGITIIAVKRSINWLARADYWFSLDDNEASFHMMLRQRAGVRYYCAVPDVVELPANVTRMERISSSGEEQHRSGTPQWWLWRWGAMLGLCTEPGKIHSGNSAWGALGLAYHLGYDDVLLVGVDGTQDARISDKRSPNNLSHLHLLFQSALSQVRLRTVGTMKGIPQTTLEDWLK